MIRIRRGRRLIESAPLTPAAGERAFEEARRRLVSVPLRAIPDGFLALVAKDPFTPRESARLLGEELCNRSGLDIAECRELLAVTAFDSVGIPESWSVRIREAIKARLDEQAEDREYQAGKGCY